MRLTQERRAPPREQEALVVQGGAAYLTDRERHLAPSFARGAPRQRAMASRRGLLSPAERQNSWPVAEVSGDTTPDGMQHRLRGAWWDPAAVLVIDETGVLKNGRHSAGVVRQSSGTAGRADTPQPQRRDGGARGGGALDQGTVL